MTDPRRLELADYVHELADTHHHVETYQTRSITGTGFVDARHATTVPALLTQLADNDIPSATVDEGPRPGFASKPAARLDALVALTDIDLEINRWILDIGEQPRHLDTPNALRQLHSIVAASDPLTRRAVERDVRRWWTRARIVTGWDSPAWTPDNTCPSCGERGSLRIRLADHIGMCTGRGDEEKRREPCGATWDESTIGVLADHIRAESEAERQPRTGAGPCWCPVPKPVVADLSRLCPGCGSARCRHALGARLLDTIRAGRAS
jgi:hypothetical protein